MVILFPISVATPSHAKIKEPEDFFQSYFGNLNKQKIYDNFPELEIKGFIKYPKNLHKRIVSIKKSRLSKRKIRRKVRELKLLNNKKRIYLAEGEVITDGRGDSGKDCSGTIIPMSANNRNRAAVITAAHCVAGVSEEGPTEHLCQPDKLRYGWFSPKNDKNRDLDYPIKSIRFHKSFCSDSESDASLNIYRSPMHFSHDIAFIEFNKKSSIALSNRYGTVGLRFKPDIKSKYRISGFPDGNYRVCQEPKTNLSWYLSQEFTFGIYKYLYSKCFMRAGSSGGAWMNKVGKTGTSEDFVISGITSFGFDDPNDSDWNPKSRIVAVPLRPLFYALWQKNKFIRKDIKTVYLDSPPGMNFNPW